MVPHAEMPRLVDPPGGVLVTANHQIVDEAAFGRRHLSIDYVAGHRASRLLARAAEAIAAARGRGGGVTAADAMAIHADRASEPAAVLVPLLLAAAAAAAEVGQYPIATPVRRELKTNRSYGL